MNIESAPIANSGDNDLRLNNPSLIQFAGNQTSPSAISQLTGPSTVDLNAATSPIGPQDTGIPPTPTRHVFNFVNDDLIDQGYDSDGQQAPWHNNEVEDYTEGNLKESNGSNDNEDDSPPPADNPNPNPTIFTREIMMKMNVHHLKDECKKRGLSVRGKKIELQERLNGALISGAPLLSDMNVDLVDNLAGGVFDPLAHWELLEPDNDCTEDEMDEEELIIDGVQFRGPTQGGNVSNVERANYTEQFDRPVFTGMAKQPVITNSGQFSRDCHGKVKYEERPHTETLPNIDFIKDNKLDLDSHPASWFQAFLPIKNTRGCNSKSMTFSMENALSWTNTKARMQNAGLGGRYPDFKDFTLDELMKHTILYLFQGLSPSPQVEMKFKSSVEDPINGNDFVHKAFGGMSGKSSRRHKHFKAFFACVDPLVPIPSRDTHPNWKVHPLLKQINSVSKKAVSMGRNLSCDEQTIGFQGKHKDKLKISFKNEGDGFMADALCSDGYTYNFHFRHQAPSQKFIKQGLSPLHSRVCGLISQLPAKNYTVTMDNLYNSAKFCRVLLSMDQKVMAHGVARMSGRGVPKLVLQKEVTKKSDLENVRNTVKVAVLKGDSVCKPLVCISLYDSKPVYILTTVCSEVKWIGKKRKVWHKERNEYVWITFMRLNVIDFYNNNMGSVDHADQLRNYYRYDTQWHRNRKWWWALWWWGYQLLLTNAYLLYLKFHTMHHSKNIMSHYDFIKSVVMAWLDQETYWPKKRVKRKASNVPVWDNTTTRVTRARHRRPIAVAEVQHSSGRQTRSSSYARRSIVSVQAEVDSSSSSSSSSSSYETVASNKNKSITELALHPINGSLKVRLNDFMNHLPVVSQNKRPKCQLHRWARGRDAKEVRGVKVVHCNACNVDLCLSCWKKFHECANLVEIKDEIAKS